MRAIIELHCQRIPKDPWDAKKPEKNTEPSTIYDGKICLRGEPGVLPLMNATFGFEKKELQEIGVWLHYLTRFVTMTGVEFCVRMFQKAPNSSRPAVAMDLTPTQVNKIYASRESAMSYFDPIHRQRNIQQENKDGT